MYYQRSNDVMPKSRDWGSLLTIGYSESCTTVQRSRNYRQSVEACNSLQDDGQVNDRTNYMEEDPRLTAYKRLKSTHVIPRFSLTAYPE